MTIVSSIALFALVSILELKSSSGPLRTSISSFLSGCDLIIIWEKHTHLPSQGAHQLVCFSHGTVTVRAGSRHPRGPLCTSQEENFARIASTFSAVNTPLSSKPRMVV